MEQIKKVSLTVSPDCVGTRLDLFLAQEAEISRSAAVKLIESDSVTVNGKKSEKKLKLCEGDVVELLIPVAVPYEEVVPQDIPLDIVYEDADIAVINKPEGMVVHPAAGNPDGTLVNAIMFHCKDSLSGIGGVMRPGIVHRIDKDTSGLLVIAKNDNAHIKLSEQLKTHTVSRIYYAIVVGNFKDDGGTVDAPMGRHPVDRKRMAVFPKGDDRAKEAVTHYTVIERFEGFSLVRCELETGRTHQIRVHMAHRGHPILGDEVYGGDKTKFFVRNRAIIHGQCLHAKELTLIHPSTNTKMTFNSPLPENMLEVLERLRRL
ncbi:MAG: RluA family pseudouridine synthase [Clostridia bacterium]|nr:RluA family pseudouridine synthase [Clostridia bacterium]